MLPSAPSSPDFPAPRVAILLGTFHGHRYLKEQLDSIVEQTYTSWAIWASDDGSDAQTLDILLAYQLRLGRDRLNISRGPGQGFAANFLSLTCNDKIIAEYFAYADQDDIWDPGKLVDSVECLAVLPVDVPALYCGRTLKVDELNRVVGLSALCSKPTGFGNALVQSIASGNTMVFNRAARDLLMLAGPHVVVAAHDWWTYLLVSGSGGIVLYDPQPRVRYRQHGANLIGFNNSWEKRLKHSATLLRGRYRNWNELNLSALQTVRAMLTVENQYRMEMFLMARAGNVISRWRALRNAGVYRQTLAGNVALYFALLLTKL